MCTVLKYRITIPILFSHLLYRIQLRPLGRKCIDGWQIDSGNVPLITLDLYPKYQCLPKSQWLKIHEKVSLFTFREFSKSVRSIKHALKKTCAPKGVRSKGVRSIKLALNYTCAQSNVRPQLECIQKSERSKKRALYEE